MGRLLRGPGHRGGRGDVLERDGAAWCVLALERGKQGYGSTPVHKAGLDWKRTANSLFEAWRVHELRALIAEQAALSQAFFVDEPTGDQ